MESTPNAYTIERYTAEMDAVAYIEGFHDTGYFIKFRQQCGNYGRRYGCRPFDYDPLSVIAKNLKKVQRRSLLYGFMFEQKKISKMVFKIENQIGLPHFT